MLINRPVEDQLCNPFLASRVFRKIKLQFGAGTAGIYNDVGFKDLPFALRLYK